MLQFDVKLSVLEKTQPLLGYYFFPKSNYKLVVRQQTAFPIFLQEVQNGRLFRLLAKLGTINERPE